MAEDWIELKKQRPPAGQFVRVRMTNGDGVTLATAKRKLVGWTDWAGNWVLLWHNGKEVENGGSWDSWQSIPGETVDLGPGFC